MSKQNSWKIHDGSGITDLKLKKTKKTKLKKYICNECFLPCILATESIVQPINCSHSFDAKWEVKGAKN